MKKADTQQGFTLIELVVVIVILGILSAVALPRFMDLRGDAKFAAAQGIAGALSSASSLNFARFMANSTAAEVTRLSAAGIACNALANTLLLGGTGQYSLTWSFPGSVNCSTTPGVTQSCQVTSGTVTPPAASASALIICTG